MTSMRLLESCAACCWTMCCLPKWDEPNDQQPVKTYEEKRQDSPQDDEKKSSQEISYTKCAKSPEFWV